MEYFVTAGVALLRRPPMSSRSNPFEELERLFERLSRQFEDPSRVWEADNPLGEWTAGVEELAVDLVEHDEEFVVTVDLPGFEQEDVDIQVTDHTLRIEAERDDTTEEHEQNYLRRERRHETMRRSLQLPDEVDKQDATARMKQGVLTITLPKVEVEQARTIDIA
jgi:HSP20 family protein